MLTAIVGINWGDEGKGRMVDLLSENEDIVVRYQGGNNAGHTVINEKGKFILNLLPSGIIRENIVNVMGTGMVIDIAHLCREMAALRSGGIKISPKNLKISDKAVIVFPYHIIQDCIEEDRLAGAKYGSTRRGIAPVYGDKYMKKAIRMGDLLCEEYLEEQLRNIIEWKNLTIVGGYGKDVVKYEDMISYIKQYGEELKPYIANVTTYLTQAQQNGKKIMFEAQLGALRDIDFGIYPYTSSSSTIAAYATIGAGVPGLKLDKVIGVIKAYSSCVGEGPFTCEFFGEEGENLRRIGGEYGAATGRPRRVGPFDVVASRYGIMVQGATELALTKMDILSEMEKIPVCVAYEYKGKRIDDFPTGDILNKAKPIVEYLPGWKTDISTCRKIEELPKAACDYIEYINEKMNCKVTYISIGAERDAYIKI